MERSQARSMGNKRASVLTAREIRPVTARTCSHLCIDSFEQILRIRVLRLFRVGAGDKCERDVSCAQ